MKNGSSLIELEIYSPSTTVTSFLLHVLAFVQLQVNFESYNIPLQFYRTSIYLLSLGCALSISLFWIKRNILVYLIFAVRVFVFLMVTATFGTYIGIKLTLAASILLDLGISIRRPVNLLMSFLFLFIVLYSQQSFIAWGVEVEKPSAHDLISLAVYLFAFSILGFTLNLLQDFNKKHRIELERLNQAVLKLTNANTGFQKYANLIERKSIVDERHRITSEIHDSIGHTITNIIMMVEAARHLSNSESNKLRERHIYLIRNWNQAN